MESCQCQFNKKKFNISGEEKDDKILNKKRNKEGGQCILKSINFNNQKFPSPLVNIAFKKDIVSDSYIDEIGVDNIFIVFDSIDNILYLVYANNDFSIIFYHLIDNKKINEIKKAHDYYISNFRHYFDKNEKRDLILSISGFDNTIKLWNINKLECILTINEIYKSGEMTSGCFINENNNIYIVVCHDYFMGKPKQIKVFDLKGKKIKQIKDSNKRTFFVDNYYDNKNNKNYIIAGNNGDINSYDYYNNKLYHKYNDEDYLYHDCIIIDEKDKILRLFETSNNGFIRIWNFHSGELIKRIKVSDRPVYGKCLWKSKYIFVGCNDFSIKLVDLNNGDIVQIFKVNNYNVLTLRKIFHPRFGECLIFKGSKYDPIKLWVIKN